MNEPHNSREALMVEALGDMGRMMRDLAALTPQMEASRQALEQANQGLRESLARFESHVLALTEHAKIQAVKHIAAKTDEAARRTIAQHSQAMADAARVALGAEVGATMQRWQVKMEALLDRLARQGLWAGRWQACWTHGAAALLAALASWGLSAYIGRC